MTQITDIQYLQSARKAADINLQLLETLIQLGEAEQINISAELLEMIEYALELNWQQYRLTTEKLKENDVL